MFLLLPQNKEDVLRRVVRKKLHDGAPPHPERELITSHSHQVKYQHLTFRPLALNMNPDEKSFSVIILL